MLRMGRCGLKALTRNLVTLRRGVGAFLRRTRSGQRWLSNKAHQDFYRQWLKDGPRCRGEAGAARFVILDHCYSLDVEALVAAESSHELWVMPLDLFAPVFEFFPPEIRDFECVYGSAEMQPHLDIYRRTFAEPFVGKLCRDLNFDILLCPSDLFYWFRPIIEEVQKRGLPVVVQDKEGTLAPGNLTQAFAQTVVERYPPIADQYYFWSQAHQDFWLAVGVAPDRAKVLGQPRADFFRFPERWPRKSELRLDEARPLVVAFTFAADAYVELLTPAELDARFNLAPGEKVWTKLRTEFHEEMLNLARERPDVQVVFKAHPQQWDVEATRAEVMSADLENVQFLTGAATASHLMVRAEVICGFQTTALLEAMMTPAPILYAGWGREAQILDEALIPLVSSGGCLAPQSRDEFAKQLRAALDGDLKPDEAMKAARNRETRERFGESECARRVLQASAEFSRCHKLRAELKGETES